MSAKQYLTDATTRHQVFLQRFAGSESKKAVRMLNRLRRDINARLAQEPTEFQRNRLVFLIEDINKLYEELRQKLSAGVERSVSDLAVSEAEFAAKTINKVATVDMVLPASEYLALAVTSSAMNKAIGNGLTISQAITQFAGKKAKQVENLITDGLALGDSTQTIARNVNQLIGTTQAREIRTVVQTAVNHSSSVARKELYAQNAEYIEGYEFVATLDTRTTLVCAGNDGKIFTVEAGIMPPLHWNCRSTTIPAVVDRYKVAGLEGTRPAIGADGVEQVSANQSYGTWLKNQPVEFVDEALGVERSKLFRSGKLTIDKFTDPTGRVYTLSELENMNGIAMIE